MASLGSEPSVEEILSSIKRIISEEDDRSTSRPSPTPAQEPGYDDGGLGNVLELKDAIDVSPARGADASAGIVSDATAQATRGALDALSRLPAKPEASGDGAFEGLIREMLRPMLREWLDAHLPALVEDIVAREIAKIVGRPG